MEVYELTTEGGGTDFAAVISTCQTIGPYCLIGGLAVNCYVEPVYTLDADLVLVSALIPLLSGKLGAQGFHLEVHPHSVNVRGPNSRLRVQFTTDARYQEFPSRAEMRTVLGIEVPVACLRDVVQGLRDVVQEKLWAFGDPQRRFSKRKKDELDLIRLGEAYPELVASYPAEIAGQLNRQLNR